MNPVSWAYLLLALAIVAEVTGSTFLALYTTNFTEPLSYQASAFLKLPKFP